MRKLAFIHTSSAAIGPLIQFYNQAEPEFEIANLLEDGLLRLLAAQRRETALRRLSTTICRPV